jgi:hypothetical protein
MSEEKIKVIAYSGYRGEEIPKAMFLHGEKIEVVEILERWIEEGLEDKKIKRGFKMKGSDGAHYQLYYDEKTKEWFYRNSKLGSCIKEL